MPLKSARMFALSSLLCLTLTSCRTMVSAATEPPVVDSFCAIAKPFTWSRQDTRESVIQAQEHNAIGKRLCGWGS